MNCKVKLQADPRYAWIRAFVYALLMSALVFLPFVIIDKGLFLYYGDFNVQQIPFYQLVHRAVRGGEFGWNWFTDLGVNFIGSYSFYNLFSPFFWLTVPFPTAALPYLMAPLLVLKTACAAATGCLYASRFVRDTRFAIFAGILYAFSGFTTYNIFFNHFHEVIVFFPLMLYALERLVVDGKRGFFAVTVAINAVVNYWFFIGSVIFVLIYFIVRTASRGWRMTLRKFLAVALESVCGVLVSGFALLPSVLAILGNPRTTSDNLLSGWGFWLYFHEQRLPAILQSIFFPPDIPSRPNFFPDHGAKWSSLSAWLPMIGPSFVLAYVLSTPRSWLKRVLYTCLIFALIPGLNSVFVLLNNSYYTRWFYMPILMMAVASAIVFERFCARRDTGELMRGWRITAAITVAITVAIAFTPSKNEEGNWEVGLMEYHERFWIYFGITAAGLAAVLILIRFLAGKPRFIMMFGVTLGVVCVAYSITLITMGRAHSNDRDWMRKTAINHSPTLPEPGGLERADIYDNMDNLGMYWGLPNIQAFHSIIPVSLMEFYPDVGVKRDVSSKPQPEYYALRSLLSVRWLFVDKSEPEDQQPSTQWFSYYDTQLGFNIYQNDNYLPMGISYDYYVTRSQYNSAPQTNRPLLLHKGVLIEDENVRDITRIIDRLPDSMAQDLAEDQFLRDVAERRATAASHFERDTKGFSSEITVEKDSILFFSVPYDKGWRATVDGVETKVLKVNGGFVGVPINAGTSAVRFDYRAPGLLEGALFTIVGLFLLAAYLLIARLRPVLVDGAAPLSTDLAGAQRPAPVHMPLDVGITPEEALPDPQEGEEETTAEGSAPFVWQPEESPAVEEPEQELREDADTDKDADAETDEESGDVPDEKDD